MEMSNTPILNLEVLDSLRAMISPSNPTFLEQVLEQFFEDALITLNAILQALEAGDAEALADSAHKLRSSSANLGAERLSKLCQSLEYQGNAGIIPDLNLSKSQLESEYNIAKAALQGLQLGE
jgi:HPt (histidine-containing phosphotransfer) domain-containing protein